MNLEFYTVFDCNFSLLPTNIITRILGYLKIGDFKNASSVCKSWYQASTDLQFIRTLIVAPTEENFLEISKSNRKFGVLKLEYLYFDKEDNHYFGLFEKIGPFIYELHINDSDLKIHHLLKLLELTIRLEFVLFYKCSELAELPSLFPLEYDSEAKTRIVNNLSGIKNIVIEQFINIPFVVDLVQRATNLERFEFNNESLEFHGADGKPYQQFFTIFDNKVTTNLRDLKLHLNFFGCADDFITNFVNIKNLNLRSCNIVIWWIWEDKVYKSSLFRQLMMKLQNLVEFSIYGFLIEDQLSVLCQHLANLTSLDCLLGNDQAISELANLKQLKELRCRFHQDCSRNVNFVEMDNFFKCKFESLQIFHFEEFVTEENLKQLCENHPNLIELNLTRLLTGNLEIIFKHLTKLRILIIHFGVVTKRKDLHREYEYKISRLQDLEEIHLAELVYGICENDMKQLKKLRITNLPTLFRTLKYRL